MNYNGAVNGADSELSIEKEGLRLGRDFLDFADVTFLSAVNHRVIIDTLFNRQIEISMLGFSFDGFWNELCSCFGDRSLEALFVEEEQVMLCEGEYGLPGESGRGHIALYPDSVCILPVSHRAVRIPLCYTENIELNGYQITLRLNTGESYSVGKMGYDTMPFAERAKQFCEQVKKTRTAILNRLSAEQPFTQKGLFRTGDPDNYWNAAFGRGTCALEFFTDEDTATYLYRFNEPEDIFLLRLRQALEATGIHREIIYLPEEKIKEKPLYRMAVQRSAAVRFLRERSDGRLIHSAGHAQKLSEYLNS
ncbi:MAG: hypothetical protein K6G22_05405 [Lachnospiraceae bacterium]|nr:hypothetical protein [Lachnospiraceae bacterium]